MIPFFEEKKFKARERNIKTNIKKEIILKGSFKIVH